jgi:hypothetical protein
MNVHGINHVRMVIEWRTTRSIATMNIGFTHPGNADGIGARQCGEMTHGRTSNAQDLRPTRSTSLDETMSDRTSTTNTVLAARLRGIVQAAAPAGPNNTELFLSLSEFRSFMEQVGGIIQHLARREQ